MADEEVNIEFDVNDKASPKLSRLEKTVEKLDARVGRASEKFMHFAEMAGAAAGIFGAAESLRGAKEYIDHVDRISNLTGLAAENVAGMSEALQIAGVESGEVEGLLTRMVKKSALLTEENKAQAKLAQRYGVNLTDGPQKSMLAISKLVEDNKIGAGQVGRILGVQGATLANMMDAMTKGPEALGQMFDDAIEKNRFMGGETLDVMQDYDESVNRVHIAWKRLTAGIIVKVAPAMTKLASKFEDSIEGWSEKAGKFANYMVNHMEQLIKMAKTYAKIMLVNNVLEKFTGKGIVGTAGRVSKGLFAVGGRVASSGVGAVATKEVGGALGGAVGIVGQFFMGALKLRPILMMFGKLTLVGAALFIIYEIFKGIMEATSGAGVRIREAFSRMWTTIKGIGATLGKIFSEDAPLGRFSRAVGAGLVAVFEWLLSGVNKLLEAVQVFFNLVAKFIDDPSGYLRGKYTWSSEKAGIQNESAAEKRAPLELANRIMMRLIAAQRVGGPVTGQQKEMFKNYVSNIEKYESSLTADEKKDYHRYKGFDGLKARYGTSGGGAGPSPTVYQDFRGSKFDITQAFAEGFDPDRIAVAFANDISSIGERKLQSGFSPLFSIR